MDISMLSNYETTAYGQLTNVCAQAEQGAVGKRFYFITYSILLTVKSISAMFDTETLKYPEEKKLILKRKNKSCSLKNSKTP